MSMTCDHSAPHSGAASYLQPRGRLRLTLVCDRCGAEREVLGEIDYRPNGRRLVGHLAELTGRELGLAEAQLARVRLAAQICDIGREQIPAAILNKRGALSDDEWVAVRRQPELGAAVLSEAGFDDIRDWILCHRERPDGTGYPRGLVGEQIPLEALILAVCDAYAAMTSDRAHRPARSHDDACRELSRCAGSQFDATVVRAFLHASAMRNPRLAQVAA
jgi:HD-GYP domain-containing protein (c-di-GMP phosphodiesterase class II)